jgi:excisionase family DNA binding protein
MGDAKQTTLGNLVTLMEAARAIGKRKTYLRQLIDAGQLPAYQVGGTAKNPWLRVDLEQAKAAVLAAMRYVPPATSERQKPARGYTLAEARAVGVTF